LEGGFSWVRDESKGPLYFSPYFVHKVV